MKKLILDQKSTPKMLLERVALFVIGCFSFIVVPFCFFVSLALITSVFGVLSSNYKISIMYALPFAILFGFLGVLMTIVGWRLIHYKHTQQRESLLVPFGKWFRDLGWLFAWTFGGDGVYDIIHSDMKGVGKLLIAAVLLFAIKKGRKIKNALVKNKGTANNAFNADAD